MVTRAFTTCKPKFWGPIWLEINRNLIPWMLFSPYIIRKLHWLYTMEFIFSYKNPFLYTAKSYEYSFNLELCCSYSARLLNMHTAKSLFFWCLEKKKKKPKSLFNPDRLTDNSFHLISLLWYLPFKIHKMVHFLLFLGLSITHLETMPSSYIYVSSYIFNNVK